MKKGFKPVTVCICLFLAVLTHAQQIDSLLHAYDQKIPQEKLFVHFDNSLYTPGQTVWYKAYLIKDLSPSDLSKNLYIDWFDEAGKLVQRTVAPVINATASGDFTVPKKYAGNNLQVMAYTKWMLNFDSSFLFHQTLRVAHPEITSKNELPAVPSVTTLQFFPEGGDMIENISGSIAFKALNGSGLPVQVSGIVTNRKKQEVAQFKSEHDGMGKLLLKPLPGETYTAEWIDPVGNIRTTQLPVAKRSGIVLSINNESVIRQFTIERTAEPQDRFKKITLIGSMNQQVVYNAVFDLTTKTKIAASLPATDFPSGILQLTLFDSNKQPVTERILFVNNEEYVLPATIHLDTLNLAKHGKNVYQIELNDTVASSLSISVMENESEYNSSANIVSQLLLSSDLRGRIHNPGYYFASPEDSVAHHLDLVMLTNGWRRFEWKDVFAQKIPELKFERDSSFLSIGGKIDKLSANKMKKTDLVNLILQSRDSSVQYISTPLLPDGSFYEPDLILYDTTKVYYRLNRTSIPILSRVTINNSFLPFDMKHRHNALYNYLPDTSGTMRLRMIATEQKRLDSLIKLSTLKEVIVRTKIRTRIQELDENYTSGVFIGSEGASVQTFNVIDDRAAKGNPNIFKYLATRAQRGLRPRNAGLRPPPYTLFLDEHETDAPTLEQMPMSEIAYVKIFNTCVCAQGNGHAIVVYTKKGNDIKDLSWGLAHTVLPGYTPVKEFYSPNYAEMQQMTEADVRRTLYWKPDMATDGSGKKINVSFYNNDISHSFRIVLQGLAQDGRMIYVTKVVK